MSAFGIWIGMDIDFCENLFTGNLNYRACTSTIFFTVPMIIILYYTYRTKKYIFNNRLHKRSHLYFNTCTKLTMNILAYLLFIGAWTPYTFYVYFYPDLKNSIYNRAIVGLLRSGIGSLIYFFISQNFRDAFTYLYNYFLRKRNVNVTRVRTVRSTEYRSNLGIAMHHLPSAGIQTDIASSSKATNKNFSDADRNSISLEKRM